MSFKGAKTKRLAHCYLLLSSIEECMVGCLCSFSYCGHKNKPKQRLDNAPIVARTKFPTNVHVLSVVYTVIAKNP